MIRASVDGFHRPRAERFRRGRDSAAGCWLDSYDYQALTGDLLDPLGPAGSGRYRTAVHDLASDQAVELPWQTSPPCAVLIVDGLFLHRDELRTRWELSVFLDVPFAVGAARLAQRDGTPQDSDHPALARDVGGQRLYFAACAPWSRASLVIDNELLAAPTVGNLPQLRR